MNRKSKSQNIKKGMLCIWIGILFLITGCWDYQELNEHGFVLAVGIDKSNKKGEYLFTYQLVNPSVIAKKTTGNKATPITTYSQTARTLIEAERLMTQQNSRRLFFSHRQILVISEELLREGGILKILDALERDPQGRINYPVLIARKTQANRVLSVLTPLEDISAYELKSKVKTAEKYLGENRNTELGEMIENLMTRGADIALGGVEITNHPKLIGKIKSIQQTNSRAQTKLRGIGLFNEGKLVHWADNNIAQGIVFASGKMHETTLTINCNRKNKDRTSVIVKQSKTKVHAKILNNKPIIHMNIYAEGRIGEVECPIDLENPDVIHELEKRTAEKIKKEIEMAIQIAQQKQSDVFRFGEAVHQSDPKTWTKWKDSWKEHYTDAQVIINVKVYLRSTGLRTNPYTIKKK